MQDFIKEIARKGGQIGLQHFGKELKVRRKGVIGDLVTNADEAVNSFLIESINARYPDHQIHSEELSEDINPGAVYEWVIDPIDGTRNFASDIPFWCTMLALLQEGETVLGVVFDPVHDQLYFAEKGGGAFLNDRPILVNKTDVVDCALGGMICDPNGVETERFYAAQSGITRCTGWLQNMGSMILSTYVINGNADFFINNCGYDHDYLPAALIASEAGALVTDIDGKDWKRGRRDLVIANPSLHSKLMEFFD